MKDLLFIAALMLVCEAGVLIGLLLALARQGGAL